EVSLVLDVSGSMAGSKLTALKPAAKNFVDKIFNSAETGKVSMSLIVYDNQVSAGADLLNYFSKTSEHTKSNCIEFDPADFKTTTMRVKTGAPYQRNAHFDAISSYYYDGEAIYDPHCPVAAVDTVSEETRAIIPFSNSPTTLKTRIDSLVADGNTSIDLGAKWGVALLDPSTKPVVQAMIAGNKLPSNFSERPYDYNGAGDKKSLKVMVLMTDGENTEEYKLKSPYNSSANSVFFRTNKAASNSTNLNDYSIYNAATNKYYSFFYSKWGTVPFGSGAGTDSTEIKISNPKTFYGATVVPWKDLYQTFNADHVAYMMSLTGLYTRSSWYNTTVSTLNGTTKDNQTKDICAAAKAKDKGIVIYTIAFQAGVNGKAVLNSCASLTADPNDSATSVNYYEATTLSIDKVFSGIVNSINKLRLTH
ncbi:MAG: VWA domain-containing protein, partial [Rhodobacteraceae bacterium]|nr:VWA domain-containing protein [Paracoccaceae bacterium]